MIGHMWALLAASAAAPEPRRREVVMIGPPPARDRDLPERALGMWRLDLIAIEEADRADLRDLNPVPSNRTTSPTPRNRGGRWSDWQKLEHEHVGRLSEQYARQPAHAVISTASRRIAGRRGFMADPGRCGARSTGRCRPCVAGEERHRRRRECLRWSRAVWLPVGMGDLLENSTITVRAIAKDVAAPILIVGGAALLLGGIAYGLMLFGAAVLR